LKVVPVGNTSNSNVDVVRIDELQAGRGFNLPGWGGRLVQLGCASVEFLEEHGRNPRFKEDFPVVPSRRSIENMFQIQSGIGRDKEAFRLVDRDKPKDPVVPLPVFSGRRIVTNNTAELPRTELRKLLFGADLGWGRGMAQEQHGEPQVPHVCLLFVVKAGFPDEQLL
jgi:hypothetical protein